MLSARPVTVAELAEAVIVRPIRPFLDPDERFDDEQSLLTIVPGEFGRIFSDRDNFEESNAERQNDESYGNSARFSPTIQSAHHSVKDYLLSSRVARQDL
jgi:hypothetical protein